MLIFLLVLTFLLNLFSLAYLISYTFYFTVSLLFFFLKDFLIYLFIYLFLAVLGLRFLRGLSPVAASGGHSSFAVRGPLTIVASLVAEHRLQTRMLSSCGSRA